MLDITNMTFHKNYKHVHNMMGARLVKNVDTIKKISVRVPVYKPNSGIKGNK